jgi:farnesyl diphosphate synthase
MTTCRAWTTTCCAAASPTCHVEYDEATALLVGDSLQTWPSNCSPSQPLGAPQRQLEMLALLAHASGSRGMAGGQAIDLASVGKQLSVPNSSSCTSTRPAR